MAPFGKIIKAVAVGMVVVTATIMVLEIEIFYEADSGNSSSNNNNGGSAPGTRGNHLGLRDDLVLRATPSVRLPNEGRLKWEDEGKWMEPGCKVVVGGGVGVCVLFIWQLLYVVCTTDRTRGEFFLFVDFEACVRTAAAVNIMFMRMIVDGWSTSIIYGYNTCVCVCVCVFSPQVVPISTPWYCCTF